MNQLNNTAVIDVMVDCLLIRARQYNKAYNEGKEKICDKLENDIINIQWIGAKLGMKGYREREGAIFTKIGFEDKIIEV